MTDDERREVARTIRHAWVNVPDRDPVRHHLRVLNEIYEAVGISDGEADAINLFNRLGDLIDPPTQCPHYRSDRHYCSIHDVPSIDRDALLALADGLCDGYPYGLSHGGLEQLARRIRKALGVSDG